MKESKVITKKDLTKLGVRSTLLQSSFNYERMQAGGFTWAMLPALKKIYKDDQEGLSRAMEDHLQFINTHGVMSAFLMGLLVSLEEAKEDRQVIKALKVALFGPLAGIGDAIFWFTLLPIVAGVCASFAQQGSLLGPILFFLIYVAVWSLRIPMAHVGYNLGTKAVSEIKEKSKKIGQAATKMGVTVIGGLIAAYVNIVVIATIPINAEHSVSIQTDFLDKIFPKCLPMAYTLLMMFLLKKKVKPTWLILITFAFAILGSLFGIL